MVRMDGRIVSGLASLCVFSFGVSSLFVTSEKNLTGARSNRTRGHDRAARHDSGKSRQ